MDLLLSFSVVLPLCVYILLGIVCGKARIINESAASGINRLVFTVLYPIVMFDNITGSSQEFTSESLAAGLVTVGIMILICVLMVILAPFVTPSRPRQGSFIQAGFRANLILFAIPLVNTLCGQENMMTASFCLTCAIPMNSILSVIVLETKRGQSINLAKTLKGIAVNPLIIGTAAGFIWLLTGLPVPDLLRTPIKALASIVTPLALISMGSTLRFDGIRRDFKQLCLVSFVKLILFPLVTVICAQLFGFGKVAVVSLFALSCVPTAVAGYAMAEEMGADGPFAAEAVAFTTVGSIFTIFLWVLALTGLHII